MSGIVDFITRLETEDEQFVNSNNPLPVTGGAGDMFLRRMAALIKPLGVITGGSSNRLSIDVNSGTITTVTTVTTVATVTTVNQFGGIPAFALLKDASRTAYNTGVRSNLVV